MFRSCLVLLPWCHVVFTRLQAIEDTLQGQEYEESKVNTWINTICEDIIAGLTDLKKPFKYTGRASIECFIVTAAQLPPSTVSCVIMQNTGAGVETSVSSYWDVVNDDYCIIKWPSDTKQEAQSIACLVFVAGTLL